MIEESPSDDQTEFENNSLPSSNTQYNELQLVQDDIGANAPEYDKDAHAPELSPKHDLPQVRLLLFKSFSFIDSTRLFP